MYLVLSVSFKEFILFFLKSTSLSGSVCKPTTQVNCGLSWSFLGKEFSFTSGIFDVLNPGEYQITFSQIDAFLFSPQDVEVMILTQMSMRWV